MCIQKFKTILFILLLLFHACNFKNENIDPNNLTGDKLTLANRLPTVEYYLAGMLALDIPKSVGNTMGQVIYVQGNTAINTYNYSPTDGSKIALWNDVYAEVMFYSNELINQANDENASVYRAIARINYAIAAITATSIWGEVPYTQIFQPSIYFNPDFDSQESIYDAIQILLDAAISDLNNSTGVGPTTDDYIFNGNTVKWLKLAHALKARYYMHLIKKRDDVYDLALNELNQSLQSNDDNAFLKYKADNVNNYHPLYNERAGTQNTLVDPDFAKMLIDNQDIRADFYTTSIIDYATVPINIVSRYGPFYSSKDSYVPIFTYEECLFIKTEIDMKKSGKQTAAITLNSAIKACLQRVCTSSSGDNLSANYAAPVPDSIQSQFAAANSDITLVTDDDAWKKIFEQKYIALFLQSEIWNDYRRSGKYVSGVDGLPVIPFRTGNAIPRRYNYTYNEINYNTSTPTDPGIYARVWWDSQ